MLVESIEELLFKLASNSFKLSVTVSVLLMSFAQPEIRMLESENSIANRLLELRKFYQTSHMIVCINLE